MFARILSLAVLTALLLAAPAPRAVAQEVFRAPAPAWVEDVPVPPASGRLRATSADGVIYLLADRQIAWSGEEMFTWDRTVTEVTDPAGLDRAAGIVIAFDPAVETVTLTHLRVLRAGQVIDAGATPATVMRRATGPDDGVIDGTLTASLRVPDLRVGDVVDYAVLRRSLPRFPGDNRGGSYRIDADAAVGLSRLSLDWPAGWPTYFTGWPARVSYTTEARPDGVVRHVWTATDAVAPPVPEAAPPGWTGALVLQWSADPDWSPVAAALTDPYLQPYPLGTWDARVEQIRAGFATDAERAIAALRMVQDDLRSVSLPLEAGGLTARAPAEVVASGFGDGKDKALLFRTMLDRLGIAARVALTDRDEGRALNGQKPRMGAFDHAIVRFEIDGTTFWADPSVTQQGGDLWNMVPPDYGYTLPLDGPNRQALEPIPAAWTMQESLSVTEDFAFGLAGVHLSVITTFAGRSADDYRRALSLTPRGTIEADLLDARAARYPGLRQAAVPEVIDDRTYNSLTLVESYFLPAPDLYAGDLIGNFPFAAPDFTAGLPASVDPDRAAPVWFGPLADISHTITVTGAPFALMPPDPQYLSNAAWSYAFEAWQDDPRGLSMNWSFNRLKTDLPAREAGPALADVQAVTDGTTLTWDLRAAGN